VPVALREQYHMFTIPSRGRVEMWRAVTAGQHAEGVVTRGMQMCLLLGKQRGDG
jgi:hypothetical protein